MEAAFFDLDKTIVSRSSSLALSRPLYRAGLVSRGQLLRGAYAQLVYLLVGADEQKMERLKEGMLQLTKGWDRGAVERLVEEVLLDVIDPYVYQEALDLIELHRSEGRRIYIVSSSPRSNCDPSLVISASAASSPRGLRSARTTVTRGSSSSTRTASRKPWRSGSWPNAWDSIPGSFAYSDSITDVPMLELVGHPVAVNPDRELRTIAEERGWEARDFRSPVRLRSRLASAVPAPRPSVLAIAGGVVAVVAVLGWVALRSRGSKRLDGPPASIRRPPRGWLPRGRRRLPLRRALSRV